MKFFQKALIVTVLAASLALGAITAFAKVNVQANSAAVHTMLLTRKVNEYEGQH